MFCQFCGREVEEGQVCDCQQALDATEEMVQESEAYESEDVIHV